MVVLGGFLPIVDGSVELLTIGAVVGTVGMWLAVRGYRVGVAVTPAAVIVRGYLWSRTVPRAAVVEVTGFPALRWQGSGPKLRWTPIVAFADFGGVLPFVVEHGERQVSQLRRLVVRKRR